jgi:hypothetical protein
MISAMQGRAGHIVETSEDMEGEVALFAPRQKSFQTRVPATATDEAKVEAGADPRTAAG